jgi:hypothetical protein
MCGYKQSLGQILAWSRQAGSLRVHGTSFHCGLLLHFQGPRNVWWKCSFCSSTSGICYGRREQPSNQAVLRLHLRTGPAHIILPGLHKEITDKNLAQQSSAFIQPFMVWPIWTWERKWSTPPIPGELQNAKPKKKVKHPYPPSPL